MTIVTDNLKSQDRAYLPQGFDDLNTVAIFQRLALSRPALNASREDISQWYQRKAWLHIRLSDQRTGDDASLHRKLAEQAYKNAANSLKAANHD